MTALRSDVSVLYVDPRGPYPKLVADWWDEARDATWYSGPAPIVAHPPCGPWGRLRHLCTQQNRDLAPIAVLQVQTWGGVLEHPAHSTLFSYMRLPALGELPDAYGGITIAVDQCDYGHVARKPTWLYLVGISSAGPRPPRGRPTHYVSGSRERKTRTGGTVPPGIKVCSAEQRRRTPLAFAQYLIDLAATSRTKAGAA